MNIHNDEPVKHVSQRAYDLVIGQPESASRASRSDQSPRIKKDAITLSDGGKQLQRIMRVIQAVPDVRVEKVANLQKQIAAGTYQVSDDDLIDTIIGMEAR